MVRDRVSDSVTFERTDYGAVVYRDEMNEKIRLTGYEIEELAEQL